MNETGKLPPQALEAEEAVLGALMLEKDAIDEVIDILSPDAFYKESNAKIYTAILTLNSNSESIDILTVSEQLKKSGELENVGGAYAVTMLTSNVAGASNIANHAKIIQEKFLKREIIRISSNLLNEAYDDTAELSETLGKLEIETLNLTQRTIKKEAVHIKEVSASAMKQIEVAVSAHRNNKIVGIPSGIPKLDRYTGGASNGSLIIQAGRPAMGKTSKAIFEARCISLDHNIPVAFFSLEMSAEDLVHKVFSIEADQAPNNYRRGTLSDSELTHLDTSIKKVIDSPFYIDDTAGLSIFEFRSKARRLKMKHNIGIIYIDYLQLMTCVDGQRRNREQEISTISRNLKITAKELNIPIVALSQLNRGVESRAGDKRPQLSDLRESGAIEQDADMVQFIHRPEYYGFMEDEEGNCTKNKSEIIIAKNRFGETGIAITNLNECKTNWNYTEVHEIEYNIDNNIQPNRDFEPF